jgi:hypothetical protein
VVLPKDRKKGADNKPTTLCQSTVTGFDDGTREVSCQLSGLQGEHKNVLLTYQESIPNGRTAAATGLPSSFRILYVEAAFL